MTAAEIAAEQAEDEGLWFVSIYASEAYLQAALRRLTAAVEAEAGEIERLTAERDAARELLSRSIDALRGAVIERDKWQEDARTRAQNTDFWREKCEHHMAERDAALLECNEQARLLGMGSSREARLMAEVEKLKTLLEEAQALASVDDTPNPDYMAQWAIQYADAALRSERESREPTRP